MKYPFEAEISEIEAAPEPFVSAVFSSLASEFLTLPKGEGFVEYAAFETAYESLKKATRGFAALPASEVLKTVLEVPISLVVLRSMLGFTPPEWAYLATQRHGLEVSQGFARTLDREIRVSPLSPLLPTLERRRRIEAMVETACHLLEEGCPEVQPQQIHRLQKADTLGGLDGLRHMAAIGAPYAMLLYERFLGRPFAGHRDSVSELVGDGLENAIEEQLARAGISFRKTRRAERFAGFDLLGQDLCFADREFPFQDFLEDRVTKIGIRDHEQRAAMTFAELIELKRFLNLFGQLEQSQGVGDSGF